MNIYGVRPACTTVLTFFRHCELHPTKIPGLAAHLCRVIPNTAIMFTCYEMVVRLWRLQNEQQNSNKGQ